MAEDEQSGIICSIRRRTLLWQPNFVGFYRAMLCIRGTSHGPVSVCV